MTTPPALSLEALCKRFGDQLAVDNLHLEVRPGEIFGLLGRNGAGKSTTINMIAGVTRITSGRIKVYGHDNVSDYLATRRITGVMHQEPVIEQFFTIGRALEIHAGYYGVSPDKAWRDLLIERLDLGPHLKKRFVKLSGGMKRRFMMAKALIHKPKLLILDEPSAGVDLELRQSLWKFVREINLSGTAILLTTHNLDEAEMLCDRIAIMDAGRVVVAEPTAQLVKRLGEAKLFLSFDEPLPALPEALRGRGGALSHGAKEIVFTLSEVRDVPPILALCHELSLSPSEIEIRKPGLEDAFINLLKRPA